MEQLPIEGSQSTDLAGNLLRGGSGGDTLTLLAGALGDRAKLLLDGGRGWDACLASENVKVINCEGMLVGGE